MLSSRVEQLIVGKPKGKPLFGLKASQNIGRRDEEPVYDEDMPEPPVSPKLKDLVLKHEKRAKENSELDTQPRQKPRAKFRDSFILDTKDEGLYSTFQENGFSESNSLTRRPIVKNSEENQKNETIFKSKSQSTIFQSKKAMRFDGSVKNGDFSKGEVSSVKDDKPQRQLTRGHHIDRSLDDLDAAKSVDEVNSPITTSASDSGDPEITKELNGSDGDNRVVTRNRTSGNFESIQKRFSQESFDRQDSRRSSKETNGYERAADESPAQSTSRSTLIRGDSIKALKNKFQQASVSPCSKPSSRSKPTDETTKMTKNSCTTSFLDNSGSKVRSLEDVITRMRNADLVVKNGDTDEDVEARALLNKFLGATVILRGIEEGVKSPISSSNPMTVSRTDASILHRVEEQNVQKSHAVRKNSDEQELASIQNERQLHILLESCPDHDRRKKIRSRLRQIMAEQKARTDVVVVAPLQADTDGTTAAATSDSKTNNEVSESNATNESRKSEGSSYVKPEVHTRTTSSSNRLTKANSVSSSPFAKFQQLERQNSAPISQSRPCYTFTDPALARSASTIKDRLLCWVKAQTKEYKNLQITNFSTSWSDGLAFCALIHHFYPEAFDYDKLKPENRRENFEIAFKVAEDEADIAQLLDVEDMVVMRKPDWKCVFTYVQSFYRRFHNSPQAVKPFE